MSSFTKREHACSTRTSHRTQKSICIILCRQKNPDSREDYASELHQVILRLSKVGRTSCEQMVSHGRVQFIIFQSFMLLCMKKLREDGLIPDDLDKALSALPSQRYNYCPSRILYALNDTFILDFSSYSRFASSLPNKLWRV